MKVPVFLLVLICLLWWILSTKSAAIQEDEIVAKELLSNQAKQAGQSVENPCSSSHQPQKPGEDLIKPEESHGSNTHKNIINESEKSYPIIKTSDINDDRAYIELPQVALKPVTETRISRISRGRLVSESKEMLQFINDRRSQHALAPLSSLPTGLNTQEVLQLTNAKLVADGKKPLKAMPTGMPDVDINKRMTNTTQVN